MKELSNLSIKELIESIDENILETKELRKKLVFELNRERDVNVKKYKNELIKKYSEDISRYRIQKINIEEMMKDHAVYAYKKTAQEGQVQEQLIPAIIDGKTIFTHLTNYDKELIIQE